MKMNKLVVIILFITIGSFNQLTVGHAKANVISTVSGEIVPGAFSMSVPNDLRFIAKLTGQKQSISMNELQTTITDYRGIENGWQIVVKSPNYKTYNGNYQLKVNEQYVSDTGVIVYKNDKQVRMKNLALSTSVELSAEAKAGSYGAELEWNLQPNIKNKIQE